MFLHRSPLRLHAPAPTGRSGYRLLAGAIILLFAGCAAAQQTVAPCAGGVWMIAPGVAKCGATQLTLSLAGIAGSQATSNPACAVAATSSMPFSLSYPGGSAGARVVVNTPWLASAAPPDRASLLSAFRSFRDGVLSTQATTGTRCMTDGGGAYLLRSLANALPLPVGETLQYAYGLDPATNSVDLTAGMRIRVANASFVSEENNTSTGLSPQSAFTASGQSEFEIAGSAASNTGTAVAAGPFLQNFSKLQIDAVQSNPGIRFATSSLDLSDVNERAQFSLMRLIYPSAALPALDSPSTDPAANPMILRAKDYPSLDALTTAVAGGAAGANQICPRVAGQCVIFYGRATVIPEIQIRIQNTATWVPFGTTLLDILTRERPWISPATTPPGAINSGLLDRNGKKVSFDTSSASADFYRIPLIGGDDIDF